MADYWKAESGIQDTMLELVGQNRPDLAEVSEEGIVVVFREKASKAAPWGAVRKVTDLMDALLPEDLVFIIELPADVWTDQDRKVCPNGLPVQHAMIDALLCACRAEEVAAKDDAPSTVKYSIAKPDIQAFRENLERFGNWFPKKEEDEDEDTLATAAESIVDLLDDNNATMTISTGGKSVTVGGGA
jgi:hypothetical protein